MSEPSPTAAAKTTPRTAPVGDVRGAIARAAQATGTDFTYLLAQARLESGLNPSARAATSSAAGLYQFTGSTWLAMLDKHGAAYGVPGSQAPGTQALGGHASRAQLLALRSDPELSAMMAGELAGDNRDYLTGTLGREPDSSELYLAHFLGQEGAGTFLSALASNPGQSAAALLPKAASANRAIFFSTGGARSVGEVMDLLRGKMARAMGVDDPAAAAAASLRYAATAPEAPRGGPIQQQFNAAAGSSPDGQRARSMADTLRDAFALGGPSASNSAAVPAHVRAAYGQLKVLGI